MASQKIIECVPNFSEGQNENVIQQIAQAIRDTVGVKLLHVDVGFATNRTVMTFVGDENSIVNAAFSAIQKAAELIDMRVQKGEHPRMGATDVCPFIPIANATMEDCIACAKRLGERVANELNIPVYLYEQAATADYRRNLANVRAGEYEGIKDKIKLPEWQPDFGKAEFNERSGNVIIGARNILIAYNVNLNTTSVELAHYIAADVRESGRKIKLSDGKTEQLPGKLKAVKAIGWFIKEYGFTQVSMNLTDIHQTPIHIAFDEVEKSASKNGIRVTGSELIGLIPLKALTDAGEYYLEKQGFSADFSEEELLKVAIKTLGLNELKPFVPHERIIEYLIL